MEGDEKLDRFVWRPPFAPTELIEEGAHQFLCPSPDLQRSL